MAEWKFNHVFLKDLVAGNCKGVIKKSYLYFNIIKFITVDGMTQIQLYNKNKLLCSVDVPPSYQPGDNLTFGIAPDSRMKIKIQ